MKYKFVIELYIVSLILLISYLLTKTSISPMIKIYFRFLPPIIYIFITTLVFYYFIKTIVNKDRLIYLIVTYTVFLIIILFLRIPSEFNVENKFYIIKWIKLIWKDRTVFINVIGNILIFIPYGYILKVKMKKKSLLIFSIIPLVIIELIQYVTKLGIFDFTDILLNYLGTLIGTLGEGNMYESKPTRRKQRKC